jgi:glutamate synthase (NADPH/NADH) large chain
MPFVRRPGRHGLYDPAYEHENCGVGFIANIKGKRSHKIIEDAAHILCRMDHRGARGAEQNTGDGAGMLTALPDAFLRKVARAEAGITLPAEGNYAAGVVFLPVDEARRHACKRAVERIVEEAGQLMLGWRRVPVNNAGLGPPPSRASPRWKCFSSARRAPRAAASPR